LKSNIRILHVVSVMNRGGVETWLKNILCHIDRDYFRMDFLVNTELPGSYDNEIRKMGSRIIPCLDPAHPWRYAINFFRVLIKYGPYDVIHSHVHHYSGFVLLLAFIAGVPARIAHSHIDTQRTENSVTILRKCYFHISKWLIQKFATDGIACCRQAAINLFGADWKNDRRWRIIHYGINLSPFEEEINHIEARNELGLPPGVLVIGHVARFHEQKNHIFLIEIIKELDRKNFPVRLLMIGDGPLRPVIENKVQVMGLSSKVIFAGERDDLPRMMKGAMDVFMFPSLYEGLPVVVILAQAAGLPCLISDTITDEVDFGLSLVTRLSLAAGHATWIDALDNLLNERPKQTKSHINLQNTAFNIKHGLIDLQNVYLH
jgi:glycosyltransferase involved in cell wall biosynthesis